MIRKKCRTLLFILLLSRGLCSCIDFGSEVGQDFDDDAGIEVFLKE